MDIVNARLAKNVTLKWVPSQSCAVIGCSKLTWYDVPNADQTNGVCFMGSLAPGVACYCDDACTRYKDCCYDYQYTCKVGNLIAGYPAYGGPQITNWAF